jgi:hypothetical protein
MNQRLTKGLARVEELTSRSGATLVLIDGCLGKSKNVLGWALRSGSECTDGDSKSDLRSAKRGNLPHGTLEDRPHEWANARGCWHQKLIADDQAPRRTSP